jgi:hypothetical protein
MRLNQWVFIIIIVANFRQRLQVFKPYKLSNQNVGSISHYTIRVTRASHLIFLDLITLIIFGKSKKSYSLHKILHPPIIPSILDSKILLDILFPKGQF